jgi:threonine dehydratase
MARAKKTGVIAASAGNHAQGVACTCHSLGISATIVMPENTPTIKVQNTAGWGARTELVGQIYDDSYEHARREEKEKGLLFVHPYNDPLVMAGQGTVALEMVQEKYFSGIEAVVIPVGGGGLVTGCAGVLRTIAPHIKIYGVAAERASAACKSFYAGHPVNAPIQHTIAEGVATKHVEADMLARLKSAVDVFLTIDENSIAFAIAILGEQAKLICEGAGALPVAAVLSNQIAEKKVALVLSGGNIDLPTLSHVFQRGLVEQGRLARLLITIPDQPGALNSVTEVLAANRANILQVLHQRLSLHTAFGETEVEVDIETRSPDHTHQIMSAIEKTGLKVSKLR